MRVRIGRESPGIRGSLSACGHFDSGRPDARVARPRGGEKSRNHEAEIGRQGKAKAPLTTRDDITGHGDTAEPP